MASPRSAICNQNEAMLYRIHLLEQSRMADEALEMTPCENHTSCTGV